MNNVVNFSAFTDLVVVGHNPEMADYSNPRGEIVGYAAYVRAEFERGDTLIHHVKTARRESESLPQAVKMADALNARLARGMLPVDFDQWPPGHPIYGSPAYVEYGQADDVEWERQTDEEAAF